MIRLLPGDCREVLATLPADSVHCCMTSPPYYGLRDYGTARWVGGDVGCQHRGAPLASSSSTLAGYTSENVKVRTHTMPVGRQCHCGATRMEISVAGLARDAAMIVTAINRFLMRYTDAAVYVRGRGYNMIMEYGNARKALVKPAIEHFVAARNGTDTRWPTTWKIA
jgi:hypothetical protein